MLGLDTVRLVEQVSRHDRLTASEADAARAMIDAIGEQEAARRLGLCSARTLVRAVARVNVSSLTARVVRVGLAEAQHGAS